MQKPSKYKCRLDSEAAMSFAELYFAALDCTHGVLWKSSVAGWKWNIEQRVAVLAKQLQEDTYRLSNYNVFMVSDPKPRVICSTTFRDRVVQRAMCNNGLYHALTAPLIYDCGACLVGRGIKFSVDRVHHHLANYYTENHTNKGYFAIMDIHHYFDSTPHEKLKEVVAHYVKDPWFQSRVFEIIDSFKDHRPPEEVQKDPFGARGIGLGSQISQLLQTIYLSSIDHYIKDVLRVKHYFRYMDDMLVIAKSYAEVKHIVDAVDEQLKAIGLTLNGKTKIGTLRDGFTYIQVHHRLRYDGKVCKKVSMRSLKHERKHANKILKLYLEGEIPAEEVIQHFNCWAGSNCFKLSKRDRRKMKKHIQVSFEMFNSRLSEAA